jgi:hypothetical protein
MGVRKIKGKRKMTKLKLKMKTEIKTRRQTTWGPPLGLLTMLGKISRRRGFVITSKGALTECVVTENGQHVPLTW